MSYDEEGLLVDWDITPEELEIYKGMIIKLRNMLEDIADEINLEHDITGNWLWSAAHHSGTLSLGKSADNIVDPDLKLHGCGNVYVCDGSVIQEHSYANTGLMIGSMAMRLAERIRNA